MNQDTTNNETSMRIMDKIITNTKNVGNLPGKLIEPIYTNTIGLWNKIDFEQQWGYQVLHYLFVLVSLIMICIFLYTSSVDNDLFENVNSKYKILYTVMPLFLLCVLSGYFIVSKNIRANNFYTFSSILVSVALIAASIYFFTTSTSTGSSIAGYITGILFLSFVITSLAVLFYFSGKYLQRLEGVPGFITHVIFYIPCLLLQFIGFLKQQFNDTTNDVFYLFLILIALIIAYLYLPKIIRYFYYRSSIPLLPKSVFLDSKQAIAGSDSWKQTDQDGNPRFNQHFGLSLWLYLNNQPSNYEAYAKETTILEFGGGAPKITYEYEKNAEDEMDKLNIYFTNNETYNREAITLPIKKQKWNNLVFNYNSMHADIFVNGVLERTLSLKHKYPVFKQNDILTVGADNGLDGAISNIVYYPHTLTKNQIISQYNINSMRNPPEYIE